LSLSKKEAPGRREELEGGRKEKEVRGEEEGGAGSKNGQLSA